MNIVGIKLGICIVSLLLVLIILSRGSIIRKRLAGSPAFQALFVFWLLFRLLPYLIIFVFLGIAPTSDVEGFWDMAYKAAEGQLVYRDFWSPYSPLYAYFLGGWTYLWHDPRIIVFAMLVMEGAAVGLSYRFYAERLQKEDFLFRALLYFLLPGSLVLCVIGAQEDIWMWLFATGAVLAGRYGRNVVWYALTLAFGILVTKAVFVLFLFPLFLLEKDKYRFSLPLVIVGLLSFLLLYRAVGLEFLQPVGEADTLRAPNILSVINPWTYNSIGVGKGFWNWTGLLVTLAVGFLAYRRSRGMAFTDAFSRIFIATYAALMVVQQSAYSNYIFIFLLPLTVLVIDWNDRKQVSLLLLYNILCVVHPSYWWRLGMPKYYTPADIGAGLSSVIDYSMQVLIVLLTIRVIGFAISGKASARAADP